MLNLPVMNVENIEEHDPLFCLFDEDTEVNGMLITNNKVFTFHKEAYHPDDTNKKIIFINDLEVWVEKDKMTIMNNIFPN